MSAIVRQLLDFARRPRAARKETVDVGRAVEAAVAAVGQTGSGAGSSMEVSLPAEPVQARADAEALERVVVNLVENAVHASEGGRVKVSLERLADGLCIKVEDSGDGVPPKLRQRIFEPFFTTKPVGEGTGLGLAVVHGLVDELGGGIEVGDSALGGARFDVFLPEAEAKGGEAP